MSDTYAPPDTALCILFEDADLLAVDKPSGLLSVPGKGPHLADCLISRLQERWPTALVVHRLDRDTSGVMVFALTPEAQRFLGRQFELRAARKTYVALVHGRLTPKTGRIDLPLCTDWPNRPRQHVDHENGKPAITDWTVLADTAQQTRVQLMPRTGRSHQLRVHMQALGHPILGDPFYATGAARDHPRLMLHSETLRIKHPRDSRAMRFSAPVPF
ncbi:MAG: RluA family pseudouridine synthase [Pseudomonadota bacterium]